MIIRDIEYFQSVQADKQSKALVGGEDFTFVGFAENNAFPESAIGFDDLENFVSDINTGTNNIVSDVGSAVINAFGSLGINL